jgi:hypothetical protein
MNPLNFLKEAKRGFKKADVAQIRMVREGVGYGQSVLDPRFTQAIAKKGISAKETPAQFLGAYASRMLIDVANDGTRTLLVAMESSLGNCTTCNGSWCKRD